MSEPIVPVPYQAFELLHRETGIVTTGPASGMKVYLAAEVEAQLATLAAENERLKADVEVGLQLTGSFFEALKRCNLTAVDVQNPGRHIDDLTAQLAASEARVKKLEEALRHQIFRNHGWNNGCALCEQAMTFFKEVPL